MANRMNANKRGRLSQALLEYGQGRLDQSDINYLIDKYYVKGSRDYALLSYDRLIETFKHLADIEIL